MTDTKNYKVKKVAVNRVILAAFQKLIRTTWHQRSCHNSQGNNH